jgi:hypothetical protein
LRDDCSELNLVQKWLWNSIKEFYKFIKKHQAIAW